MLHERHDGCVVEHRHTVLLVRRFHRRGDCVDRGRRARVVTASEQRNWLRAKSEAMIAAARHTAAGVSGELTARPG